MKEIYTDRENLLLTNDEEYGDLWCEQGLKVLVSPESIDAHYLLHEITRINQGIHEGKIPTGRPTVSPEFVPLIRECLTISMGEEEVIVRYSFADIAPDIQQVFLEGVSCGERYALGLLNKTPDTLSAWSACLLYHEEVIKQRAAQWGLNITALTSDIHGPQTMNIAPLHSAAPQSPSPRFVSYVGMVRGFMQKILHIQHLYLEQKHPTNKAVRYFGIESLSQPLSPRQKKEINFYLKLAQKYSTLASHIMKHIKQRHNPEIEQSELERMYSAEEMYKRVMNALFSDEESDYIDFSRLSIMFKKIYDTTTDALHLTRSEELNTLEQHFSNNNRHYELHPFALLNIIGSVLFSETSLTDMLSAAKALFEEKYGPYDDEALWELEQDIQLVRTARHIAEVKLKRSPFADLTTMEYEEDEEEDEEETEGDTALVENNFFDTTETLGETPFETVVLFMEELENNKELLKLFWGVIYPAHYAKLSWAQQVMHVGFNILPDFELPGFLNQLEEVLENEEKERLFIVMELLGNFDNFIRRTLEWKDLYDKSGKPAYQRIAALVPGWIQGKARTEALYEAFFHEKLKRFILNFALLEESEEPLLPFVVDGVQKSNA